VYIIGIRLYNTRTHIFWNIVMSRPWRLKRVLNIYCSCMFKQTTKKKNHKLPIQGTINVWEPTQNT